MSGRSPGEGNGNTLQYSCLGNLMDRRAWQAAVHRVTKGQISVIKQQHNKFSILMFLQWWACLVSWVLYSCQYCQGSSLRTIPVVLFLVPGCPHHIHGQHWFLQWNKIREGIDLLKQTFLVMGRVNLNPSPDFKPSFVPMQILSLDILCNIKCHFKCSNSNNKLLIATGRKSDIFLLAVLKLQYDFDVSFFHAWMLFTFYQAQHAFSLLSVISNYFAFVVHLAWFFCTCLPDPCL